MYLLIDFSSNGNRIPACCLNHRARTGNSSSHVVQRLLHTL
jgi:hypothetical protein